MKFTDYVNALRVAIRMNDYQRIQDIMKVLENSPSLQSTFKQSAFILARNNLSYAYKSNNEQVQEILMNKKIINLYFSLAKNLDVVEPKKPSHIYKKHLDEGPQATNVQAVESAKNNLADT